MFARNLIGAVIAVMFASMTLSCFTTASTDVVVAQTQLPLEASSRTVAVQTAVTKLATQAGMTAEKINYIVSN